MKLMHNYFEQYKHAPEIGEYDPIYELTQKRIPIVDFKKY